jgi:hypothetical protein
MWGYGLTALVLVGYTWSLSMRTRAVARKLDQLG